MKRPKILYGSASEVGERLQENYDRLIDSNRKWTEIMSFSPEPHTGVTCKDLIWRKNKSKLYRYVSQDGPKHKTPLLMIYALINKAYILDLTHGMSMVEHLVKEGFDVYLLDWGEFEWEDRDITYADLVYDYVARAVRKVCQASETDEISILGYCMGGTIASMYASLFPNPKIKNMIFVASPFDFEDAGMSSIWINGEDFDPDKVVDTFKLVPKSFVDVGVKMLNPVNNFLGTYTRLWKMIDDEIPVRSWRVLNHWVNDNVNFPGGAYRQWIKEFYQENKLVKNEIMLRGRQVYLNKIEAALLVLAGEKDHIVMPHQTTAALKYMSSNDTEYLEYPVGHGGLVFGKTAKQEVYPAIADWLAKRS